MGPPPSPLDLCMLLSKAQHPISSVQVLILWYMNHFEFAMNICNLYFFFGGGWDELTK